MSDRGEEGAWNAPLLRNIDRRDRRSGKALWPCALAFVLLIGCGSGSNGTEESPSSSTPTPQPTRTDTAPLPTPTATPTTAVAPIAWAVGTGTIGRPGQILRSDDGGASWTLNFSDPVLRFSAVDFVDTAYGWVTGTSVEDADILHTSDGGVSWRRQGRNLAGAGVLPRLSDVTFVDRQRGVAVGGTPTAGAACPLPAVALVTSDGGTIWRVAEIAPLSDPTLGDQRLRQVCLTTTGVGLALGDPLCASRELLLLTDDGGRTWHDIRARLGGTSLRAIACTGADDLWVIGFGSLAGQTLSGRYLAHSPDSGATWQDVSDRLPNELQLRTMHFVTPSTGVIITAASGATAGFATSRTSDAGASWNLQGTTPLEFVFSPAAVAFADASQGVVVGTKIGTFSGAEGAISFSTRDGGTAWMEGTPPGVTLGDVDVLP